MCYTLNKIKEWLDTQDLVRKYSYEGNYVLEELDVLIEEIEYDFENGSKCNKK